MEMIFQLGVGFKEGNDLLFKLRNLIDWHIVKIAIVDCPEDNYLRGNIHGGKLGLFKLRIDTSATLKSLDGCLIKIGSELGKSGKLPVL